MTIARTLAEFACDTRSVPASTREIVVHAVFDLLIAAIAGHDSPGGRAARHAAPAIWGSGPATAWFSSRRTTLPGAAFVNSATASMLDLDDGHRAAAGHPGASVIPAVLATAEACGADAQTAIAAIAAGYEIAVRTSAARDMERLDTLVTGPWCGQGAAAAAASLRGLPPATVAQAIALAGASAPNLAAVAYSNVMGNHLKEGIPWATATGLAAVELAAAGFTGPIDLYDAERVYDRARLTDGLGAGWLVEGSYFKPYGCCRWAHAAVEALVEMQARDGIAAAAIASIEVHTFSRTLRLNNDPAPATLEAAQYSVPFCVALAAVRGPQALVPLQQASLADAAALALAAHVGLVVDPQFDAMFPAAVPARVRVATSSGVHVHAVLTPKGEPSRPMTWADLEEKFDVAAAPHIDAAQASGLRDAVFSLRDGDLGPLCGALATPIGRCDAAPPGLMAADAQSALG